MFKYICSICGYVYDEEMGNPQNGVPGATLWKDVPENWRCPVCRADKSAFQKEETTAAAAAEVETVEEHGEEALRRLDAGELSAVFSNLAKGCEKQNLAEESALFKKLSAYYLSKATNGGPASVEALTQGLKKDIGELYPAAEKAGKEQEDRGALRAFTWGNKVSRIAASILSRWEKEGGGFIENSKVFVCEICGFIYIGDTKPDICPICKVPNLKIQELQRGA